MSEHTPTPWVIPAGEPNGFIICSGDDPKKPGPILMCVRLPLGRRSFITDSDRNDNTAFMVKAANSHEQLVKLLNDIVDANEDFRKGMPDDWEGDPLQDACIAARDAIASLKEPS